MGKKIRSAKGELVDFDFLKIKEQLASAPTPTEVTTRKNFIENRLKRRIKKNIPIVDKVSVDVAPVLPDPKDSAAALEEEMQQPLIVDPALDKEASSKPKTKQKARKGKK